MQIKNWTDLRFLLAMQRTQTLAKAAALLRVDATTVSRRLERLQHDIGAQLLTRAGDGTYALTDIGASVAREAREISDRIEAIEQRPETRGANIFGTVRVTSVPLIVNRLLVHKVSPLLAEYPELNVELIAESRDYSLTHREADLAIRLSRPVLGGTQLKTRRIGEWRYALYAADDQSDGDHYELPMLLYDETLAHLPQAQWIERATRAHPAGASNLRVHDAETALEAASAGVGLAILPVSVASDIKSLRRVVFPMPQPDLIREVWLVGHADQIELPRVSYVGNWAEELFR
ncbi:MAG: LysR family transcriptional regulator [Shimia sp.]|uniref:LysR family transcriptional regulator n=1 Tax=Shimia sp. TaxID=1954381 RepID=UPI004058C5CD